MRFRLLLFIAMSVCAVGAQSLSPDTQLLLDHAKADRDLFGAGSPKAIPLDEQVRRRNAGFVMLQSGTGWLSPEESDPSILGTAQGADIYLERASRADLAVTGQITNQIFQFNTYKNSIVTDSLLRVDEVIHAKSGIALHPGDKVAIARPGGVMHVGSDRVGVRVEGFTPFVTGSKYFLFLSLNPKTGSYVVDSKDAFILDGDAIKPLYGKGTHPATAYLGSTHSFLETVRNRSREAAQ